MMTKAEMAFSGMELNGVIECLQMRGGRPVPLRVAEAIRLLRLDFEYALDLGVDRWQFAVNIQQMRTLGLTNNDLRWLVLRGVVDHAHEQPSAFAGDRSIEQTATLPLSEASCFVLTDRGVQMTSGNEEGLVARERTRSLVESEMPAVALVPHWDADRQELWLGDCLVKQFKVPADNQVAILSAFQEESWPARIDDPLPGQTGVDAKRRLHNTINALNRNQRQEALRFMGDGRGQGVRWELNSNFDTRRLRLVAN